VVSRLPVAAFSALIVATVGAFFVTQHLKVSTPLIAGSPKPSPAFISPRGTGCGGSRRVANFSFYLLHRADDVSVYIVDQQGTIVRTLASGRHMRRNVRIPDGVFPWNGREDNGRIAPDGKYYFRIALLHQGRTVELTSKPVTVETTPPRPVVTSATPSIIPSGAAGVTIAYRARGGSGGFVQIYRTDLPGGPRRVLSFGTSGNGRRQWDGTIAGRPAPAGTYLVGLRLSDRACNTGFFPATIPPARGSTAHAGVTVRYLAAQPPLTPVPAGSTATVFVDSRRRPYRWALRNVDSKKVLERGSVHASAQGVSPTLSVRMPATGAGLYELAIRSGPNRTLVPLIASRRHSRAKVLVVLPALTWQGQNPVDDDHDGIPNTLENGGPISLQRPLANGLPEGFADEASLLAYLDRSHLSYDLTTDLGLLSGSGPIMSGHQGVVLAGSELWLPSTLRASLRSYVQQGGRVLSLGIDSLRRSVIVRGSTALRPTGPSAADIFGAQVGAVVNHSHDLILVLKDGLGIFATTSTAFPGFHSFQPFGSVAAPAGRAGPISAAGTSNATASIIGFRFPKGIVVEIGLPGFGTSLTHSNTDAQELIRRLWTVLSR
jgi:N,N-dimethylformamidase beta subunit-like, C-terminal/FlgD Ig-like domain